MLCPEVTTFSVPVSRRIYQTGPDVKEFINSPGFKQNNQVIGNVKIFLPECLHPSEDLRSILLHDKDSYRIEKLSSLECLATEDFIRTFVCQGRLFVQTAYGENDDFNVLLLPSGWLHVDTNQNANKLGLESCQIKSHSFDRTLISIDLKDSLNKAHLKKWRISLKTRVLINKPIMLNWYPDNQGVCPSTIAKYFDSFGGTVSQILPEIDLVRRQPQNQQIPKIQIALESALLNEVGNEGISIANYENILGAAFLGLSETAFTYLLGENCDTIECKNGLYINVRNVFLLPQHLNDIIQNLTNYLGEKGSLSKDHYASITMSTPRGLSTTLSFPGKSKSKVFSNSRQTIVWRRNELFSSVLTREQ